MKILLAPSETKRPGGTGAFDPCTLLFEELCPLRETLMERYRTILRSGDDEAIHAIFGLKKETEIARYLALDPRGAPAMKAVERYTGVAFDHLDYASLSREAQKYIEEHVIIFSNLFGPILAGDLIPDYRLKQGAPLGEIRTEVRYREAATPLLDAFLSSEEILDLRAGYYDKFSNPSLPLTTLKFLKGGKVVSHWAKAYRGTVLRHLARESIGTLTAFMALPIPGLELEEIRERNKRRELIYTIDESRL
jgi:hypothetical protein